MFPTRSTPDFVRAVESVRDDGRYRHFDEDAAIAVIRCMYDKVGGGKFGDRFEAIRNEAIRFVVVCGLGDDLPRPYELIVGRYFNPRAVRARRGGSKRRDTAPHTTRRARVRPRPLRSVIRELPAMQAGPDYAIVYAHRDLAIGFRALKESGKLDWRDVDGGCERYCLTGDGFVVDTAYRQAKRAALAIMNERRGFKRAA